MPISNIDHLVVKVPDLDAAIEAFRDMGFTVNKGGIHAGGITQNVCITAGFPESASC